MKRTWKMAICILAMAGLLIEPRMTANAFGKKEDAVSAQTDVTTKSKKEEELYLDDILSYEMTSIKWDNKQKKYVVNGYLYNSSDKYDLFDFGATEIVIVDANELEMCTIKMNKKVQNALMLPPECTWDYNMTFKNLEFDVDDYELSYGIHAYVFSECSYAECAGVGCPICGMTEEDALSQENGTTFKSGSNNTEKNKNSTEDQYVCSWCNGTGICKECGGTGKNNATSQVLKAMGCTLCDKTGKCAKCGGDGLASY